jgi:tetratricopeptide (TPR) repeat protein
VTPPAHQGKGRGQRAVGVTLESPRALASALALVRGRGGACGVLEAAYRRAQQQSRVGDELALVQEVADCDAESHTPVAHLRGRGELERAEAALEARSALAADGAAVLMDLAEMRLARGNAAAALADLGKAIALQPRDGTAHVRLADAHLARGDAARAREILEAAYH